MPSLRFVLVRVSHGLFMFALEGFSVEGILRVWFGDLGLGFKASVFGVRMCGFV